jgi:hypothetical protein
MFLPVRSLLTVARPRGNPTRFPFHPPDCSGENLATPLRIPHQRRQVKPYSAPGCATQKLRTPNLRANLREAERTSTHEWLCIRARLEPCRGKLQHSGALAPASPFEGAAAKALAFVPLAGTAQAVP